MNVTVLGAGAMGGVVGGALAEAGNDVTLVDVWQDAVDAINRGGLRIDDKAGASRTVRVRAVSSPAEWAAPPTSSSSSSSATTPNRPSVRRCRCWGPRRRC